MVFATAIPTLMAPVPLSIVTDVLPVWFPITIGCWAALAPKLIPLPLKRSNVAVELPKAIVLVPAVPILIFWLIASFPMEITPPELFNSKTPAESKRSVSAELAIISPDPVEAILTEPVPDLSVRDAAPVVDPIVIV
jgi:hypothetical protein